MRKFLPCGLLFSLCVGVLLGCARNQDAEDDASESEVTTVSDSADYAHHLRFRIVAVHRGQKPTETPPYFESGGEWTFMECESGIKPRARFTVGVREEPEVKENEYTSGQAVLSVKDAEAGGKLFELLAKEFPVKAPKKTKRTYSPVPLAMSTAIWGKDVQRSSDGHYVQGAGNWTVTKWYPQFDDRSTGILFNYNLEALLGEFSDADVDESYSLLRVLAGALRDGPRPPRTPETDPHFTLTGPKIGKPRRLVDKSFTEYGFTPDGEYAVYEDAKKIFAVETAGLDLEPRELVELVYSPWNLHVVNNDLDLLFAEPIPEDDNSTSYTNPTSIWWVDGKTHEKKLLYGPARRLSIEQAPVSPDGRYVGLSLSRSNDSDEDSKWFLLIIDRQSGQVREFNKGDDVFDLVGWKELDQGLRAVVVANRFQDDERVSEKYWANPATGELAAHTSADPAIELDEPLSPDGKLRLKIAVDHLLITDVASGKQRRFEVHEDDQEYLNGAATVAWASPRYLTFEGPRLALIDVTTLKMSYPFADEQYGRSTNGHRFSQDLRWVLYHEGEDGSGGLVLAPVEMPADK